jgi:hypothetical protein
MISVSMKEALSLVEDSVRIKGFIVNEELLLDYSKYELLDINQIESLVESINRLVFNSSSFDGYKLEYNCVCGQYRVRYVFYNSSKLKVVVYKNNKLFSKSTFKLRKGSVKIC